MSRISFGMLEAGYIPGDLGAFKKEGGKVKLYNSGPSGPSTVTQISQTYDPSVQPLINNILAGAAGLAQQQYQPYQYNRIAEFDPLQLKAQQAAANMKVSPYIKEAADIAKSAAQKAGAYSYGPGTFSTDTVTSGYTPGKFNVNQVTPERVAAERAYTGRFTDPGMASSYMSPYMQNVVDIQKREAQRQADIAATQRGAQAVGAGAFGGSRQAIMEAEAQRNLAQQMGDIQARGSQAAYEQAAQQFQTDEARNLAMQQSNIQAQLQAALANQQTGLAAALANQAKSLEAQQMAEQARQFGAESQMRAALSNQAKRLEAQQLAEQSRQFGADVGLRGLQSAMQGAGQLGMLGQTQFGQAKDIIGLLSTAGGERQARQQAKLTQDYEDFLRQKQFPYQQAQFIMEMARGMPLQSTQSIYAAPPSPYAQLGGLAAMYAGGRQAGYFGRANGGLIDLGLQNLTK